MLVSFEDRLKFGFELNMTLECLEALDILLLHALKRNDSDADLWGHKKSVLQSLMNISPVRLCQSKNMMVGSIITFYQNFTPCPALMSYKEGQTMFTQVGIWDKNEKKKKNN